MQFHFTSHFCQGYPYDWKLALGFSPRLSCVTTSPGSHCSCLISTDGRLFAIASSATRVDDLFSLSLAPLVDQQHSLFNWRGKFERLLPEECPPINCTGYPPPMRMQAKRSQHLAGVFSSCALSRAGRVERRSTKELAYEQAEHNISQ